TNSWTEVGGDLPAARNLPAVARHGSTTIIVGGRGAERTALADAWQLPDATAAFSPLAIAAEAAPGPRWGASLIDDPTGDGLVLFGGTDGSTAFGDLWALGWQ
ncbi:MAG: kelch repeat-containing protein, partial [Chloroflexota bacterium]